jgi:hypothetical protein
MTDHKNINNVAKSKDKDECLDRGTKRKNSREHEPHPAKIIKKDMEHIYERTLNTLMKNAKNPRKNQIEKGNKDTVSDHMLSEGPVCIVCNTKRDTDKLISCTYCGRYACDTTRPEDNQIATCSRLCEKCNHSYCEFCSVINHNAEYDRIFCLDCNTEEEKKPKNQSK